MSRQVALTRAGGAIASPPMCNLYRLRTTRDEVASYFRADPTPAAPQEKDYVSPGRPGLVVRDTGAGLAIETMGWGWPPPRNARGPVVNVRNYASPMWRSAIAEPARRCLVPVTEFQEWSVGPDPITGKKRPHWFRLPSRPIFAFAGIWRPSEAGAVYAFLTTGYDGDPAHHLVGAIHPKAIPVILHEEDHDRWLSAPVDEALSLTTAFPSQLMAVE